MLHLRESQRVRYYLVTEQQQQMYGKIQEFRFAESFLSYASQLFGASIMRFSSVLTAGNNCSLMAAGFQVLFFLGGLGAQKFTSGGPKSPMAAASLFTDMAGNTPFHILRVFQIQKRREKWIVH